MNKIFCSACMPICLFCTLMFTASVVGAVTKEQAVKAGFVYNIAKFVVWPSHVQNKDNFTLCVFGDDKLGGGLEALYGKNVGKKTIVLKRVLTKVSVKTCDMTFIGNDEHKKIKQVIKSLNKLPILTISDSPNFINNGGMVELVRDGRRVGFEVNIKAVRAAGLNMSAQLLKLAKDVKGLK